MALRKSSAAGCYLFFSPMIFSSNKPDDDDDDVWVGKGWLGRIRRFARMLVRRSDGTLCLLDHLSHPFFLTTQMYYKQTKGNSDFKSQN